MDSLEEDDCGATDGLTHGRSDSNAPAPRVAGDDKPVDIVYILGKGSVCDNYELRLSLRSLCRFGRGIGRVIVAGKTPKFLSDEVIAVPCADIKPGKKHVNILNAIRTAAKAVAMTRPFLYSSDDHFLSAPVDFRDWPIYCRFNANKNGYVYNEEECRKIYKAYKDPSAKLSLYNKCLVMTRAMLESEGLLPLWTNWHGNTWMFPEVLDEARELCERNATKFKTKMGYEPTLVVNALHARDVLGKGGKLNLELLRRDVKSGKFNLIKIFAASEGRFSVSDMAWLDSSFRAFMEGMFLTPCKYEKEYEV